MRFLNANGRLAVFWLGCAFFGVNALALPPGNSEQGKVLKVVSFSGEEMPDLEKGIFWVVDPQSGRLRAPTDEEMVRIAPNHPLTRSAENITETHYSDGSSGIRLESGFEHMVLVRRKSNGELETTCVTSMAQALDFLSGDAAKRREVVYDR